MSGIATAVVAGSVVTGYMGSKAQSSAAGKASDAQVSSTQMSIEEQRRQFEQVQKLLSPYGENATGGMVSDTQSVLNMYQKYIGRNPSAEVLAERVADLRSGKTTLEDLERGVSTNPEAQKYALSGKFEANLPKGSLTAQRELMGLEGADAQAKAIDALSNSPQMQSMLQQGENSMLQNASATGGLRGGNTQAALAQFRPQLLSQMIESQFSNLGQLTNLGQASAAGQAAAGQQTGSNIAGLLSQQGQALAGNALAQGQAQANMWGGIGSSIGNVATLKALKVF